MLSVAPWYYVAGTIGTLAIILGLSFFLRRYVRNLADYYVMGRKANWILIMCTLTATWMSMWTLVGGFGVVWSSGPWYIQSYFIGSVMGIVFFMLAIGPAFRRGRFLTVPDFFAERFGGNRRVRAAAVAALILGTYFYIVLQVTGGSIIFEQIFGVPYFWGMIIFLLVVMFAVLMSGTWSVVVTDAFGFTIFMIAGIALPIVVAKMCGGLSAAILGAGKIQGAQYWEWLGKSGWTVPQQIGNIISWFIILSASPHLITRGYVAKDTKEVYKGTIGTLIAGTTLTFLLYIGAVGLVNIIPPGSVKPDWLGIHAALNVLPAWLGILYLMGAFAAGYTTAIAQFITCAQGIARDIFQALVKPNASDKEVIRWTWISMFVIAAATAVIGAIKPWLLIIAGTITGMIFSFGYFPSVVLGLFWDRLTAKAVEVTLWLSIPLGIFAVWTWTVYKWFQPHPTIWGAIIGFGLTVLISLVTKKTPEEEAAWKKLKPIFWPKQPTLLKTASDYWFIGISSAVITAIGLLIMGLYRGWFFWA